jgi:antirestriction protein ArdC
LASFKNESIAESNRTHAIAASKKAGLKHAHLLRKKKLIKDLVRLKRPKVIAAAMFNAEQIDGIPWGRA